jgi:hypothetical protein
MLPFLGWSVYALFGEFQLGGTWYDEASELSFRLGQVAIALAFIAILLTLYLNCRTNRRYKTIESELAKVLTGIAAHTHSLERIEAGLQSLSRTATKPEHRPNED